MFEKKRWWFFLILYFVVALFYTFPLIFTFNSYLIGRGGLDGFQYIWNLFSFWSQISHFHSPFFNNLILYPVGVNLLFSDYSAFSSLIGLPFIFAPVFYMNLLVIGGITLSAFVTYYLCNYLTGRKLISFLAGLIYGFSSSISSNIFVQHNYYLIGAVFLPFILYLVMRFSERPNKYLKRIIFVELILFFTNYYFFILSGLLISSFLFSLLVTNRSFLKELSKSKNLLYYKNVLLTLIIIILGLLFLITSQTSNLGDWVGNESNYAQICNANIAGFLIPAKNSFVQSLAENLYMVTGFSENGDTPYYYLGLFFVLCSLGSLFFYKRNKFIMPLFISGVVILMFALGLVVRFGEIDLFADKMTPFYWLSRLPLLGMIDCPIRFVMGVHLIIAVLTALFIKYISEKKKIYGFILLVICFASLVVDYRVSKFPFTEIVVPNVYRYLATVNNDKTVLELPSGLTESKGGYGYDWAIEGLHTKELYWQTIYKKPRIGGYVSRIPESTYSFFRHEPIISDLFNLSSLNGSWSGKKFSIDEKREFIKKFNLGFIVIVPEERSDQFKLAVEDVLNGVNYEKKEFEDFTLYEIK